MPRSVSLSFELLETFAALIRGGGEASAALERLGLNQPLLSKRLRYLQHAGTLLEKPWLVRVGKRWELTDEGRRVWPAVSELVDRYENLRSFLEGAEASPALVRFACGHQTAAGLVREALREFRVRSPLTLLRISTLRGRARIEGVSNGSLDLAIVSHDEPMVLEIARRPLHVEPLAAHGLALVCGTDSPWDRAVRALPRAGAEASALAEFPLVLPESESGVRKGLDEILRRAGVFPQLTIALEVGGWQTILGYVRDGFGVGVVSEAALTGARELTIRRLDPEVFPSIQSKLICRRLAGREEGLDLSETARVWREVVRQAAHSPTPGPIEPGPGDKL